MMRAGRRVGDGHGLAAARERARRGLASLPQPLRKLDSATAYPVDVAPALRALAAAMDAAQDERPGRRPAGVALRSSLLHPVPRRCREPSHAGARDSGGSPATWSSAFTSVSSTCVKSR